jgi:hypothetical protein
MWEDAGIFRDAAGLARAADGLDELDAALDRTGVTGGDLAFNLTWHDWLNLKSLVLVSRAIVVAAAGREESRGAHFRSDFPEMRPPDDRLHQRHARRRHAPARLGQGPLHPRGAGPEPPRRLMPDIVVTEFIDEAALAGLAAYAVHYDKTLHARPDEIARLAAGARALVVRNQTQVRGPLLDACRRLEAVGRLGVGLDNIDLDSCRARGIAVLPATGANDIAVAEHVIAGTLILLRGAYHSTDQVIAGAWPRNALIGREASGRTLGLVGYGGIARQVAARAAALGMRILASDPFAPISPPAESAALDRLLAESDVVSLHVPLTP